MLMFEMCLSGTAKYWHLTLSEQLKKIRQDGGYIIRGLKSCQMSRIIDPVEINQSLPTQSDIIFKECGINGYETSACSPSHKSSTGGASQFLTSVPQNTYHSLYSLEAEESNEIGANTFQTRATW